MSPAAAPPPCVHLCVCVRLSQQHGACLDHCFKLFFRGVTHVWIVVSRCLWRCGSLLSLLPMVLWKNCQLIEPINLSVVFSFSGFSLCAISGAKWGNLEKFRSGGQWSTFHSGGKIIQCPCAGGTWFPLFYGLKANQNISGGCCNSRDEPVEPLRLKLTLRALWFRHYICLMGFQQRSNKY